MSDTPDSSEASAPTDSALAQLHKLPKDELEHLASDIGLDPTEARSIQHLVAAVYERQKLISAMDREAMLDVVRWGRRPVAANATKQQLAVEIARLTSMRFSGLSLRGLVVLAVMRGANVRGDEDERALIRKLKKQEGLFKRFARKRRAWLAGVVSSMLGEDGESQGAYQFLPPQQGGAPSQAPTAPPPRESSIRDEIEDSGLFGGLASRVKRTADVYLNQKLDEVEARIDKKLDEIDKRLAEWRDKEVANRLRIIKITLWASVIVAGISLVYTYVSVYFVRK
jgi:hypothetical protein